MKTLDIGVYVTNFKPIWGQLQNGATLFNVEKPLMQWLRNEFHNTDQAHDLSIAISSCKL